MTYPVVSLFSGAGFLDFGFSETNFEIIWGTELVEEFAAANNYNMRHRYGHHDRIIAQDVTTIQPDDIPRSSGIIGGPPCQDFSVGNAKSPGVSGERGKLVWDFLNKIQHLNPDFFVFENVEALYKTKKHRTEALFPLLEQFRSEELGYVTEYKVLNTLEYGIPQDRSRVFIVGFKKHILETLEAHGQAGFQWPEQQFENPKKLHAWLETWEFGMQVNEEEIIRGLQCPYELTVHSVIGNPEELEQLPNHVSFRPYSHRFTTVAEGDVKRKSFKRLHRFRYSPTVAYGNNEVHLHPTEPRRLTVREALRLQSVPDWYQFEEGTALDKMFKMVSNGVAYELARLLAVQIRDVLDRYHEIMRPAMEAAASRELL